jgi:hypothetical protein
MTCSPGDRDRDDGVIYLMTLSCNRVFLKLSASSVLICSFQSFDLSELTQGVDANATFGIAQASLSQRVRQT